MADKQYVTVVGFVQFDPVERDANGKRVVDLVVKPSGAEGANKNIRVTVWPEIDASEIVKGDLVAVDGQFTRGTFQGRDGTPRESLQISAYNLAVVKSLPRAEREVVQTTSSSSDLPF